MRGEREREIKQRANGRPTQWICQHTISRDQDQLGTEKGPPQISQSHGATAISCATTPQLAYYIDSVVIYLVEGATFTCGNTLESKSFHACMLGLGEGVVAHFLDLAFRGTGSLVIGSLSPYLALVPRDGVLAAPLCGVCHWLSA